MSKKSSKSLAIKSAINKSASSKSAAGKSTTGKKKMEIRKSKTTDNKQRPIVSVKQSCLPPPPPPSCEGTVQQQLTEAQEQAIKELKGRIKERLDAWYGKKKVLADYESKVINDQRQPPPAPKDDEFNFDEINIDTTRSDLHDSLGKLGDEVKKLEGELDKLKKKYQRRRNICGGCCVILTGLAWVLACLGACVCAVFTHGPIGQSPEPSKKQCACVVFCLLMLGAIVVVAVVLAVVLSPKSDDFKSTTMKMINGEPPPDGQTGEAGTSGGKGSVKTAPITTSSTAKSTTTTTTTMPPPVSNFEIACKPQVQKNVSKECLVGSSPGSCGDNAVCWRMILNIHKSDNIFKFSSNIVPSTFPPPTTVEKRMCKANDDQLGSCDQNGKCNPVGRPIDKSLYEPAVWKDNCDEPDPCWASAWKLRFPDDRKEDRETFCDRSTVCGGGTTHAHVWMQHVRCHVGKGRTANETCKGLPMQLWLCKQCDKYDVTEMIDASCPEGLRDEGAQVAGCTVRCQGLGGSQTEPAPDGFNCTADDDQPGHCYKGQCFTVSAIYNANDNPLPNLEQCKTDRDADKKKETAFMRGRRKAIKIYDVTARINVRSMSEDGSSQTVALEKMAQSSIDLENVKKPHGAA